jgi:aspartate racemase
MRKLGLLGGLSWVSTVDYYRYINEDVNGRIGGLDFAECIIYSLNFGDVHRTGWDDWKNTFRLLCHGCEKLKAAGAEAIVLCANTAHSVADELEAHVQLPLISIVTATADEVGREGVKTVGMLGTKFTMELPFFREGLERKGIRSLIPEDVQTRDFIQGTLRDELGRGIVNSETRKAYLEIIDQLISRGAQGILLGCTELPLLISQEDVRVPVFDATRIHARAAVDFALSDKPKQANDRNRIDSR